MLAMQRMILPLAPLCLLAACSTVSAQDEGELRVREPEGQCDASGVQDHVGHRATAEAGRILLELTGARTLRWVPPRTAVTMDYRPDRLTVSYDDDMIIERITCG